MAVVIVTEQACFKLRMNSHHYVRLTDIQNMEARIQAQSVVVKTVKIVCNSLV